MIFPMSDTSVPHPAALTDGVVLLRRIDHRDVDQITAACQDERLQRYIPVPRPYRREHAEQYVTASHTHVEAGRKEVLSIIDPADDRLLGVISITLAGRCGNAAYWVVPAARGRGVGRRALGLLADWAFSNLDLAVILLEIHETNQASAAVADAAGFHRSGAVEVPGMPEPDGSPGPPRTALLYSRLASDRP